MRAASSKERPVEGMMVALSVLLLVTIYLFGPWFWGLVTFQVPFFEWDVPEEYWPDQVFLCRSLRDGQLPYWNPFDRGGYPWYADPQTTAYHPLSWIPCLFTAAPSHHVSDARVPLSFLMAGVGTLFWLRQLNLKMPSALLGAVIFETSPFMRHNWEILLTFGAAHLPWVLWAVERLLKVSTKEPDWLTRLNRIATLALCLGLLAWSGSAPILWFGGSFIAVYTVYRIATLPKPTPRLHPEAEPVAIKLPLVTINLGLALVLGALLASPSVFPPLSLAEHSVQAGRSYESITQSSLSPTDLWGLVSPRPGNHYYLGIVALGFALWGLVKSKARWLFGSLLVVAVLLSLGDATPFFRLFYQAIPPIRWFRLPYRYELWIGLSAAPLAAIGLEAALTRLGAVKLWRVSVTQWALVGLFALINTWDVSRSLSETRHLRWGVFPTESAHAELENQVESPSIRYMDEFGLSCRSGTRLSRQEFRGYQDPLILAAQQRVLSNLAEHPALLAQYGFGTVLSGAHFIHGWERHYLPPPSVLVDEPDVERLSDNVFRFSRNLPRVYLAPLGAISIADSVEDAFNRVTRFAPAEQVVLEAGPTTDHVLLSLEMDGTRPTPVTRPTQVTAPSIERVTTIGTDGLSIEVNAANPGVLVINDVWYPGWQANVNGREAPILRANGLVRAIAVPRGHHRVELTFAPLDGFVFRKLWLIGCAIASLIFLASVRAKWKTRVS